MERPQYTAHQMGEVVSDMLAELNKRTKEKGAHCLVSRHEVMGIAVEEYKELEGAVQQAALCYMKQELTDLAVACMLGLLSIKCGALDW